MNRRKAIIRISLSGAGILAAAGGYKWFSIRRAPDLAYATEQKSLIGALAETILPVTDSPGATDADVSSFILKMIKDCLERKEQHTFINGLKDIQGHCTHKYGKAYPQCDAGQQEAALAYFEEKGKPYGGIAGKVQGRVMGRSFFTLLKTYTVEGYCTSQPGATRGLAYLYIPGSFHGCIPMQPGQKAWATS
ncbi:gluconate 2-dehydrogenase subunit 3 family protein [Flavitalea flava]